MQSFYFLFDLSELKLSLLSEQGDVLHKTDIEEQVSIIDIIQAALKDAGLDIKQAQGVIVIEAKVSFSLARSVAVFANTLQLTQSTPAISLKQGGEVASFFDNAVQNMALKPIQPHYYAEPNIG